MNKRLSPKKPDFIFFFLLTFVLTASTLFAQALPEDEFLTEAFTELKQNPPIAPTEEQIKLIVQIKAEIEKSAAQKKFFKPDEEIAGEIGASGFPEITELLRSPNSWKRALAARTLFLLDRERSLPFLIGQLSDQGEFKWMRDVAEYRVSSQASSLLSDAFQGTAAFTTPVRQAADLPAKIKAVQNYYWFHRSFCKWMNKVCFTDNQRMFTQLESERFGKPSDSGDYEGINYVFVGHFAESDRFKINTPIHIGLGFIHYGNQLRKIRWDLRDTDIHKFKMIAPDGRELKLKPAGLPELHKQFPVVQPQWKESSMGKDLELSAMYDITQSGIYRFYYEYTPPALREENEQSRPVRLWHWNGRDYVNYYEFIVQ